MGTKMAEAFTKILWNVDNKEEITEVIEQSNKHYGRSEFAAEISEIELNYVPG